MLSNGPEPEAYVVGDLVRGVIGLLSSLTGSIIGAGGHDPFAVLISGRGSNMTYLADAIKDYSIAAKITVVVAKVLCPITFAGNASTRVIKRKILIQRRA